MITDTVIRLNRYQTVIPHALAIQQFVSAYAIDSSHLQQWRSLHDDLKVILLNTSHYKEGIMETHRNFYDLHLTLAGCDIMRVADTSVLTAEQEYDSEKDYALWQGKAETILTLNAGRFLVVAPHEAHNNNLMTADAYKLVFKIKVND